MEDIYSVITSQTRVKHYSTSTLKEMIVLDVVSQLSIKSQTINTNVQVLLQPVRLMKIETISIRFVWAIDQKKLRFMSLQT